MAIELHTIPVRGGITLQCAYDNTQPVEGLLLLGFGNEGFVALGTARKLNKHSDRNIAVCAALPYWQTNATREAILTLATECFTSLVTHINDNQDQPITYCIAESQAAVCAAESLRTAKIDGLRKVAFLRPLGLQGELTFKQFMKRISSAGLQMDQLQSPGWSFLIGITAVRRIIQDRLANGVPNTQMVYALSYDIKPALHDMANDYDVAFFLAKADRLFSIRDSLKALETSRHLVKIFEIEGSHTAAPSRAGQRELSNVIKWCTS